MLNKCDLLVFGAHPDDAELLCGGTIAKAIESGQNVVIIDCTEAELSTNGTVETRKKETQKANDILGVQVRHNLKFIDGNLNREPALVDALVTKLRQYSPKVVLSPPEKCRHPDHQALHDALQDAMFFCGLKKYLPQTEAISRPKILKYIEVADGRADVLIDISEQWEKRKAAVMAYETQFIVDQNSQRTFINDGFLDRLERRYRHYGELIGVAFAEPFSSDIPPNINLPTDLC
jgi:bacillithiol biosynthesis deacetylase BshB1